MLAKHFPTNITLGTDIFLGAGRKRKFGYVGPCVMSVYTSTGSRGARHKPPPENLTKRLKNLSKLLWVEYLRLQLQCMRIRTKKCSDEF